MSIINILNSIKVKMALAVMMTLLWLVTVAISDQGISILSLIAAIFWGMVCWLMLSLVCRIFSRYFVTPSKAAAKLEQNSIDAQ
ncbi:hypothetical protein GBN23_00645 [Plesiomonas shigelloides]|uniref:hypothetical protein n=1 Tax=Plesiomonas shigelloides TaxID=703 RepID=UPI001262480A|nr:hypothetical protein [Plesiomonas shigelloides]KAB7685364.1 hypothetical protein GBN23_00645 [Plesiomonas shigelloides]